jgi:hypothetical protein
VPPRTAICDACLHVVDASLLDVPAAAPEAKTEGPLSSLYAAAQPSADVVRAVEELRGQWRALSGAERGLAYGAFGTLVSLGLPWRWTEASEDVIGFLAGGWPVALLSLLVGVSVFVRDDVRLAPHRHRLGGLAVGLSSLAVLACAVFLRTSFHADLLRSGGRLQMRVLERPLFGAWLGLVLAFVMLLCALLTWRPRQR